MRLRPQRMKVERHKTNPGILSPLRDQDVTASQVAALFGIHPYLTLMGLFAEKTGVPMPREEGENLAMRRGRLLEDAVARAFLEEHPRCKLTKSNVYLRVPKLRFGGTPDYMLIDEDGRRGVAEMKTAAPHVFKAQWTDDTPPTYHVLQCLAQMMLTNAEIGRIAVLVVDGYRFELHDYPIPRHPAAERGIQDGVAQFWADLAAGKPPAIDYSRDESLLPVLFPHHVKGKVVDLRGDNALPALLEERETLHEEIKAKAKRKASIDTEIKFKIGDAEGATVSGWRLTYREQHRTEHMVQASDFRVLRIARDKLAELAKRLGVTNGPGSSSAAN